MEKTDNFNTAAKWCGKVLGAVCLFFAAVQLAAVVYASASDIMFLIGADMLSFSALVLATVLSAVTLTGTFLTMRYALRCFRYGMQDARVKEAFPGEITAMILQLVYLVTGIVVMFLPVFENIASLHLQNFFIVFFPLLALLVIMIVLAPVSEALGGKQEAPAAVTPSTLLQAVKTPALWSVFVAVSLAYIFSGQHSVVSIRTDAFRSFTAAELSGAAVDESIFADHDLTLINIWATFCSPCLGEMPDLAQLHEEYADQGFQVVGVCADIVDPQTGARDQKLYEKALELEKQTGAEVYRNLDPAGDIMQNYIDQTVSAYPTSVFVDANGEQVGDMIVGSRSKEVWAAEIEQRLALLQEAAGQ